MTNHDKITNIKAREILDSRGNPTIEVDVFVGDKIFARAAAPSGASKGSKEACELRDGDSARFHGRGVLQAVSNVNNIIRKELSGRSCLNQSDIDAMLIELDGTPNKSKLGANATIATSMAVFKAAAALENIPLFKHINKNAIETPMPLMNLINGGAHANNGLEIQEFMIAPVSAKSFFDAVRMGSEIFFSLKSILSSKGYSTCVGDEGGFAPQLGCNRDALGMLMLAIEQSGYTPGRDVMLALDVAASEFYRDGLYYLKDKGREKFTTDELVEWFKVLANEFPIFSIEDPLFENDYEGWKSLTTVLGNRLQIVGDDIFVTNKQILHDCICNKIGNAILIKPNQIGTITETLETIQLAQQNAYRCVMSHRSGETEDTTIAHLAVGWGCDQIKTGSISRTDRAAKYNELIRIEEEIGSTSCYAGIKYSKKIVHEFGAVVD